MHRRELRDRVRAVAYPRPRRAIALLLREPDQQIPHRLGLPARAPSFKPTASPIRKHRPQRPPSKPRRPSRLDVDERVTEQPRVGPFKRMMKKPEPPPKPRLWHQLPLAHVQHGPSTWPQLVRPPFAIAQPRRPCRVLLPIAPPLAQLPSMTGGVAVTVSGVDPPASPRMFKRTEEVRGVKSRRLSHRWLSYRS